MELQSPIFPSWSEFPYAPNFNLNSTVDQHSIENDWADYKNLMKSIERGYVLHAYELLEKGCRVAKPGALCTALHLAVERSGSGVIVKQLLRCGARVDARIKSSNTALHYAFLCGTSDADAYIDSMMASYLNHSNKNLANSDGLNYLHIASARLELKYVKEFLKRCDVDIDRQVHLNSRDYAGFTALHFAVDKDRADIAACLLNNNASIYVQDANGMTPLHLAVYRQSVGMIDLLLAHDRHHVNFVDDCNLSHFMAACMCSDRFLSSQYLIEAERDSAMMKNLVHTAVNSLGENFEGYTPLHFAVKWGRLQTVKMLLKYGADCCALTSNNLTPHTIANNLALPEITNLLNEKCELFQARMSIRAVAVVESQDAPSYSSWVAPEMHRSIVGTCN